MSDVYRGEMHGRAVALKVLREFQYGDHEERARKRKRFYWEALIWRQLYHRNIHPFLGVHESSDQPLCIVSPWQPEGNLIAFLKSPNAIMRSTRLEMLAEIADALAYLHRLKPPLVHGDLKGANVLVSSEGIPRLADFGISKFVNQERSAPEALQLQNLRLALDKELKVRDSHFST
ncbi:kinase-like protein [Heliocybe sulcata]|uniref:Kinase-like protein n=1 Tax=Heliocybe sulcata TaxID=5364 RepID=A0A5C3MMH3_9AGAM|nr:kinase-like protein [Heliocybe sulcata]